MADKPQTRWCAIYTRKSSEEGLEQDFNSLDAQREAGEAYIKSQAHEGWRLYDGHYDDGGISGGTLDRPALQRLLTAIQAGKVQIVVVYKVDRLSRSLSDFAKLVDVFEKHGVSFVSVTQQFNTTTSMGRLMLNVLLSFAQFEREVTGERIRDKFLASRKKGMWMGGTPPLGYDIKDRKLLINAAEATLVREIFTSYAQRGCVRTLKGELDATGRRTKNFMSSTGRVSGGKFFSRGHLYHILKNRIYIGDSVHKGVPYPGEHQAIVDQALWERVQLRLSTNRNGTREGAAQPNGLLLKGILFDDAGNRMTPVFGKKGDRRYHYYVSQAVIQDRPDESGSVRRLPAHELDKVVSVGVLAKLSDHPATRRFAKRLLTSSQTEQLAALRSVIRRATITHETVRISFDLEQLFPNELTKNEEILPSPADVSELATMDIRYSARPTPRGLRIQTGSVQSPGEPSNALIKALARGHAWKQQLLAGEAQSFDDLAQKAGVTRRYVSRILRFSFLAPDLVEAIFNGHNDPSLTTQLFRKPVPHGWKTQRELIRLIT